MTQLQIYGLVMPFVVGALGLSLGWWSHRQTLRSEQEELEARSRAAE